MIDLRDNVSPKSGAGKKLYGAVTLPALAPTLAMR
jgi:hypothetical protein